MIKRNGDRSEENKIFRRNEYFMKNIYNPYKSVFNAWGYKFSKSIGLEVNETEQEAIKIALEQTEIRMNDIHSDTPAHVLHATRQRLINLCNRKTAQKRNNYTIGNIVECKCGKEKELGIYCEYCRTEAMSRKVKKKIYEVSLSIVRDSGSSSEDDDVNMLSFDVAKENNDAYEEIYKEEFKEKLREQIKKRFSDETVINNTLLIYSLIVDDGWDLEDVRNFAGFSNSSFYLYVNRIVECFYVTYHIINKTFAVKRGINGYEKLQ